MAELFVDVAEKSDCAVFELSRSLSSRSPNGGGCRTTSDGGRHDYAVCQIQASVKKKFLLPAMHQQSSLCFKKLRRCRAAWGIMASKLRN